MILKEKRGGKIKQVSKKVSEKEKSIRKCYR